MPAIKELERNIECCRREIRNLVVMGMNPSQTPDQLELIRKSGTVGTGGASSSGDGSSVRGGARREPKIKFQPTLV